MKISSLILAILLSLPAFTKADLANPEKIKKIKFSCGYTYDSKNGALDRFSMSKEDENGERTLTGRLKKDGDYIQFGVCNNITDNDNIVENGVECTYNLGGWSRTKDFLLTFNRLHHLTSESNSKYYVIRSEDSDFQCDQIFE